MKKKEYLKKFFLCWESVFLFIFMIGIFGPSEVFFGNYTELGVVYGEFGWLFFVVGFTISIIIAFVLVFFPEIIRKIILAVVWGLSIAGYIQVMFLNKGIDQIGVTAEVYSRCRQSNKECCFLGSCNCNYICHHICLQKEME